MSASIQVSDLKYDTNNGTILSVGLIVDSQSFRVEFSDHKYIVTNLGRGLVKIIAPDMNQASVTPKIDTPKIDTKAAPKTKTKAKTPIVDDAKSFGNNDQLITILKTKGFN